MRSLIIPVLLTFFISGCFQSYNQNKNESIINNSGIPDEIIFQGKIEGTNKAEDTINLLLMKISSLILVRILTL